MGGRNGKPRRLEPMSPASRRIDVDALSTVSGSHAGTEIKHSEVLKDGQVVVLLSEGAPCRVQRRQNSRRDSTGGHIITYHMTVSGQVQMVSATSPATHVRVVRKGRWLSLRSSIAEGRFIQPGSDEHVQNPRDRTPRKDFLDTRSSYSGRAFELKLVNHNITAAEQWSIESADEGEAEFKRLSDIPGEGPVCIPAPFVLLRNRQRRHVTLRVQVVVVPQGHLSMRTLVMDWAELVLDEVMERNKLETELALLRDEVKDVQARAQTDLLEIRGEASHQAATREWMRSMLVEWACKAEEKEARRRQEWGANAHRQRRLLMQCLLQWSSSAEDTRARGEGGLSVIVNGAVMDQDATDTPVSGLTGVLDVLRDRVKEAGSGEVIQRVGSLDFMIGRVGGGDGGGGPPGVSAGWDGEKMAAAADCWDMPLDQFRLRLGQAGLSAESACVEGLEKQLRGKGVDVGKALGGGGPGAGAGLVVAPSVRKMLSMQYEGARAAGRGGSDSDGSDAASASSGGGGGGVGGGGGGGGGAAAGPFKAGDLRVLLEKNGIDPAGLTAAVHALASMICGNYDTSTGTLVSRGSPVSSESSESTKSNPRGRAPARPRSSLSSSSWGGAANGGGAGSVVERSGSSEDTLSAARYARSSTASAELRSVMVRDALETQFRAAQAGVGGGGGGAGHGHGSAAVRYPLDNMRVDEFKSELLKRRMDVSGLIAAEQSLLRATGGVDMSKVPASVREALGRQYGEARVDMSKVPASVREALGRQYGEAQSAGGAGGLDLSKVPASVREALGRQYGDAKEAAGPEDMSKVPEIVRKALGDQLGSSGGGASAALVTADMTVAELRQQLAALELDDGAAEAHALEIALSAALQAEAERESSRGSSMLGSLDGSSLVDNFSPRVHSKQPLGWGAVAGGIMASPPIDEEGEEESGSDGSDDSGGGEKIAGDSSMKSRERRMRRIRLKRMSGR